MIQVLSAPHGAFANKTWPGYSSSANIEHLIA